MKNVYLIIIFLSFLNCKSDKQDLQLSSFEKKVVKSFIGIYEYEKSKDNYIVIDTLNGNYRGMYFGTENYSNKGNFFYGNILENLNIKDNEISFEIGKRYLYEKTQMKIVKDKSQYKKDSLIGIVKNTMKFNGQILKDAIKIKCESEFADCSDKEMYFTKLAQSK